MNRNFLFAALAMCALASPAIAQVQPKVGFYTDVNGRAQPVGGVNDVASRPCRKFVAITPNDAADVAAPGILWIWAGGAGNVAMIGLDDTGTSSIVVKGAAAGQPMPFQPRRVFATGTTATDLVGCVG
jgi:hypothetical protein